MSLTTEQQDEIIEYFIFEIHSYTWVGEELKYTPPFYVNNMEEWIKKGKAHLGIKRVEKKLTTRLYTKRVLDISLNDNEAFDEEGEQIRPLLYSEFINWWDRKNVDGRYYYSKESSNSDPTLVLWDIYLVKEGDQYYVIEYIDFDYFRFINHYELYHNYFKDNDDNGVENCLV